MTDTDRKVQDFFDAEGQWKTELLALRRLLAGFPLTETFKWRSPCYTWEDANVITLWRLKDHCALVFFKGALLKDPKGLLEAPGENSRSIRKICLTSSKQLEERRQEIETYVEEAIAIEKAGLKISPASKDLVYPEELIRHMEQDDAFREAFEGLTPGRRRGYLLHFSQAKQSATRNARISKHASRILMGKGMHDR